MILTVNIPKKEQEITNGDIINAIFPDIEIEQIEDITDVYGMSKCRVTYDTDWWNAPYKAERHTCGECQYWGNCKLF